MNETENQISIFINMEVCGIQSGGLVWNGSKNYDGYGLLVRSKDW